MAGKRGASSDLNHENWDREEEPEDAGTFKRAPEDAIKNRIIKTARRRNPISSVRDNDEKKSAFSGFVAFSQPSIPPSNAFSFLSNLNSKSDTSEQSTKLNGFPEKSVVNTNISKAETNNSSHKDNDYYSKLKGLNESVSKWITKHVESNPFINLQPVFKDYEDYFKRLEKEKPGSIEIISRNTKKVDELAPMSNFVFKAAENIPDSTTGKIQQESEKTTVTTPLFTFGKLPQDNKTITKLGSTTSVTANTSNTVSFGSTAAKSGTFSFGSNASTISNFSFSSSTPLTFGDVKPTSSENQNKEDDDNDENKEEEPQLQKVVESDYIYTTRCKVFLKKDGNFNVLGVGNLYLKSIEKSDKVQAIVRADNNLGNLLCNFVLSNGIPIKRMGNKDVMLVCLPTPDFEPPPVPIIIRVKNTEEADELFKLLGQHKK